jgi:hypothetical protein
MALAALRPPRVRRPFVVLAAAVLPALAWVAPGCGTDAVGIEACRAIELARCDVAPRCAGYEGSPAIETEEEVANCRTFYRDHCLLGLENTEAAPGQGEVDACVDAIERTSACGSPGSSTMQECGVELRDGDDGSLAPCRVLQEPERLRACAWLEPPPEDEGQGGGGATAAPPTSTSGGDLPTTTTGTGDAATTATTAGAGGAGGGE